MIQLSQYIGIKYIEVLLIIFSLGSLIVFVNIIMSKLRQNTSEEGGVEGEEVVKALPARSAKGGKELFIVMYRVIPIAFTAIICLWTFFNLFPVTLDSALPPDSHQQVTVKNLDTKASQSLMLLGRLSYSNVWMPLLPVTPSLQFTPTVHLAPKTEKKLIIRTGVNDIDHLIIVNLTDTNYSKTKRGIAVEVPRNDFAVYANLQNSLSSKPSPSLVNILLSIVLYITGAVCCVALWFNLYNMLSTLSLFDNKIIRIASMVVGSLVALAPCGFAAYLNIRCMLLLM